MKSYLSLIPISAKVHKRQSRMTLLCIISAVFLVTAIFSMADMGVRMEKTRLLSKHGSMDMVTSSSMAQSLYTVAAALFALVLIAGVLMISSSININIAQRTKFFGMMRCIGMSRKQIIRFVKLEALNWCKTAVPIGIILGIIFTWILCAILHFAVRGEFTDIPLFGISVVGIISGIVVGTVTVLIAATSPARRASKVSPIAAVSGDSQNIKKITNVVNKRFFKIDTFLGIHHALSAKKNFILMVSSFALSIILFLSFSVLIEFVGYIMPQSSSAPDINITSNNGLNIVDSRLLDEIKKMDGVRRVFGRKNNIDVEAQVNSQKNKIDMISFDDFELECLKKDKQLKSGSDVSKVYGDSKYVLAVWDKNNPLKLGDKVQVNDDEVEIAGLLKCNPFKEDGTSDGKITIIPSDKTFTRITGMNDYLIVSVQMKNNATEENVMAISNILDKDYEFKDLRDQNNSNVYISFMMFIYGFIGIIVLVAILNIMNSISMSVNSRIKQYGVMRAIGMDENQINKMICAEAFTYSISGCIVGVIVGLIMSKLLYSKLITSHFSYAMWSVPVVSIIIIIVCVTITAMIAVYVPVKRIRQMEVTATLKEL